MKVSDIPDFSKMYQYLLICKRCKKQFGVMTENALPMREHNNQLCFECIIEVEFEELDSWFE